MLQPEAEVLVASVVRDRCLQCAAALLRHMLSFSVPNRYLSRIGMNPLSDVKSRIAPVLIALVLVPSFRLLQADARACRVGADACCSSVDTHSSAASSGVAAEAEYSFGCCGCCAEAQPQESSDEPATVGQQRIPGGGKETRGAVVSAAVFDCLPSRISSCRPAAVHIPSVAPHVCSTVLRL